MLVLLVQAGGVYTLQSYTTSIFDEAGSSLTPIQSSLLICVVQMVANILIMFLIDRLGRKILYTTSTTGTGLGMLILALHHMYKDQLPNSNWVPIYVLSITFFIAQIGSAVPTIITIDVLPAKVNFFDNFGRKKSENTQNFFFPLNLFVHVKENDNTSNFIISDSKYNNDHMFVDQLGTWIWHELCISVHDRRDTIAWMFDCIIYWLLHYHMLCIDFHSRNQRKIIRKSC